MKILFWKKQQDKRRRADQLEREAIQTHKNNMSNIVKTKHKVDTLNKVLEQNHIVFQLAHVIGEGHHR